MKFLRRIAVATLKIYLLLLLLLFFFQDKLIFFPDQSDFHRCAEAKAGGFEFLDRKTGEEQVRALIKKHPAPKGTLVVFHGNASTSCDSLYFYQNLSDLPFNFVLAAYPGYEGSPEKPSQDSFFRNSAALVSALEKDGLLEGVPLYYFGESLGTGVAVHLATQSPNCGGLILKSPYSSVADVGFDRYPFFPIPWIAKNPFPSSRFAPDVRCPVLILHGTADKTIPIRFAEKLASLIRKPVRFVRIDGADHNDLTERSDQFWREVKTFVSPNRHPAH